MEILEKLIKNIIIIIAIAILVLLFSFNIMYVTYISDDLQEIVTVTMNTIGKLGITIIIGIGITLLWRKLEKLKLKQTTQIILFAVFMMVYLIAQGWWIRTRQATPVADQLDIYEAAVDMSEGNWDKLKPLLYFELYPQQLTLAFVYSFVFRILGASAEILQCINLIANLFSVLGLVLLTKQLSKQYQVNLAKTVILSMTFISLPMLVTFIYGDFVSMPFCMFALYHMMKYTMENKKRNAIFSAILMAIAYILRMNSLIYIVALGCYLILDLLKQATRKERLYKIIMLVLFVIISVLPNQMMKGALQTKLEQNKKATFPTTGFIYMGMSEGERGCGWFNDEIAYFNRKDIPLSKQEYKKGIKERLQYFAKNPMEAIQFYTIKTASMWTENTYSAIWYNQNFNFSKPEEEKLETQWLDEKVVRFKRVNDCVSKSISITNCIGNDFDTVKVS